MAVTVPNALALANIADGAAIVASDHRNNYAAVQVGVNGLVAMFTAAPTKGDLLVATGGGNFDKLAVGANGQAIIADSTQATGMRWGSVASTPYRKTTAKTVNTTVAATDLLNGEITIAAGVMGATGIVRLTAWGDFLQNAAAAPPRFQVVFGGTTIFDTSTNGTVAANSNRSGWRLQVEIQNLGAANSQQSSITGFLGILGGTTGAAYTAFATGEGNYAGVAIGASATNASQILINGVNPSTAVDTTAAKTLVLNVINGSASATYETKLLGALVEIL